MEKLQKLIKKCTLKVLHGGSCPILTKIASNYKNDFGIGSYPFRYRDKMTGGLGIMIADVYDVLEHKPNSCLVKAAYKQLAKEVLNQFNYLVKNEKIEFEPYEGKGEPYTSSFDMLLDIHNHHMYFFKTKAGFGGEVEIKDNVMLNKTGLKINGYELVVNDVFRIVHDIFGHAMDGYGFGPIGEDMAWFSHLKMFSPLAAAALSMETRGQNCWVNFGKHLRDKNNQLLTKRDLNYIPPPKRPFAEQKMNLLPSYISGIEVFKKEGEISANYIKVWDPVESILIHQV